MGNQAVRAFVKPDKINIEVDADVSSPVTVAVCEYAGRTQLNIRHWYQVEVGLYARTQKGVTIPFDDRVELLTALIDAVNLAATDGTQVRLMVIGADGTPQELM
jgi:hypothetical protein